MTASERSSRKSDELIGQSESLRVELLAEVEKLEAFVTALQAALGNREECRPRVRE
jgi:hypothetical protein